MGPTRIMASNFWPCTGQPQEPYHMPENIVQTLLELLPFKQETKQVWKHFLNEMEERESRIFCVLILPMDIRGIWLEDYEPASVPYLACSSPLLWSWAPPITTSSMLMWKDCRDDAAHFSLQSNWDYSAPLCLGFAPSASYHFISPCAFLSHCLPAALTRSGIHARSQNMVISMLKKTKKKRLYLGNILLVQPMSFVQIWNSLDHLINHSACLHKSNQ